MPSPLLQIDAFTDQPFRGNPAAVCLLDAPRDAAWMQHVAAEMNLSETAFLLGRGDSTFDLRWFTPTIEVALCGHATLASAHALWSTGRVAPGSAIAFETKSGTLRAHPAEDGITIDLPARPVDAASLPEAFVEALGVSPIWCGAARKGPGGTDYLVRCATEREVAHARPDFTALRALDGGIILTARAKPRVGTSCRATSCPRSASTRIRSPDRHIARSPRTGPVSSKRSTFVARQVSPRGGTLGVRLDGDRVHLTGRAVTVLRGELVD